jgi:lipopolysaccharide transport system ATP-binding protein
MSQPAIRVENLGKSYRMGGRPQRYYALRDTIAEAVRRPARTVRRAFTRGAHRAAPPPEIMWALKGVSVEFAEGQIAGILGRNGAGKSTLLKILTRITEPTEGLAEVRGRVGSLLEVGTGFHPELTGRDNIYLNGAILGMRRAEIRDKFDEIVEFAEISRFIETPVKHYSTGMYMRLAFAVAAHMKRDVLLVDEVLAVGDAAFQRKCLGKMEDVARDGRTVLFVSHDMAAITGLCDRALWLAEGRIAADGPAAPVVHRYLESVASNEAIALADRKDRTGDGTVRLESVDLDAVDSGVIRCNSRLRITVSYTSDEPVVHLRCLVGIYAHPNTPVFWLDSEAMGGLPELLPAKGNVTVTTDPIHITPGRCHLDLELIKGGVVADHVEDATRFDVEAADVFGYGRVTPRDWAVCMVNQDWQMEATH